MKPFVAKVNDYHEFDEIVSHLKLAGIKTKYMEFPYNGGNYRAVFYTGKLTKAVKILIGGENNAP